MQGNRVLTRATPATQTTVVPAKAGIQEIPRKRAGRLQSVLDSGFRRNDGFIMRLPGVDDILNAGWYSLPGHFPGRGGFLTRPGSGARICRIWLHPFRKLAWPWHGGRVTNPPLPMAMPTPVDRNRVDGWFDKLTMSGYRMPGNRVLTRTTPATQTTVVPAKAGIQEIPGERAGRLQRVLDSGFRRNDGFIMRLPCVK